MTNLSPEIEKEFNELFIEGELNGIFTHPKGKHADDDPLIPLKEFIASQVREAEENVINKIRCKDNEITIKNCPSGVCCPDCYMYSIDHRLDNLKGEGHE